MVDTSDVVKWFLNEPLRDEAQALLGAGIELHAPDFYKVELLSTLCKRVRRREMDQAQAQAIEKLMPALPVTSYAMTPQMLSDAFSFAIESNQTVYDCLFVILAMHLNVPLITADERFVRSMNSRKHRKADVRWLGILR